MATSRTRWATRTRLSSRRRSISLASWTTARSLRGIARCATLVGPTIPCSHLSTLSLSATAATVADDASHSAPCLFCA
eukprot:7391832-Prymnesium_polylepis.3